MVGCAHDGAAADADRDHARERRQPGYRPRCAAGPTSIVCRSSGPHWRRRDGDCRIGAEPEQPRIALCATATRGRRRGGWPISTRYRARLEQTPDRRLLLLEVRSGEQVHAAVAIGDPDTADHIAVSTPGLKSTVRGSLGSMADEAGALQRESQIRCAPHARTRTRDGRDHRLGGLRHAADVGEHHRPDRGWTGCGTGGSGPRRGAGPRAVLDGLGVAHTGSDPHITAIGHSYGSVTTGLALRGTGPPPGGRPGRLRLPRAWSASARRAISDWVRGMRTR